MKTAPYFNFYPADFMHGVRGLSAQEVGVYTMMLCRIYEEDGPVEYNLLRLSTYCGMREKTFAKTVEKLVDLGKLTLSDGMISNRRSEKEISDRSDKLKNNSKAGKASAEKRKQNQQKSSTTVQQTFNHTDTDIKEKEEPNGSSKKQGSRLSVDWVLPKDWGGWAMDEGLSEVCTRREADKFRDYWSGVSGAKGVKLDWLATWRNWVRKAIDDRRSSRRPSPIKTRSPDISPEFENVLRGYGM